MPDITRTFIAVAVPETLELRLTRLQQQLAPQVHGARWAEVLPFHITLAFLGDVDNSDLHALCQAVSEVAARFPAFALKLEGLGAFPTPARARVIWAGVGGPGLETLCPLQAAVADTVERLNYPAEKAKPYHPHVTLGRLKPGRGPVRDLTPILNHYRTWNVGPFPVAEIITYSSHMSRDNPVYAPLGRAPLRGKSTQPLA